MPGRVPSTKYRVRSTGGHSSVLCTSYFVLGTLLLTLGCQPFRNRPAYTADPLLWDRKPVSGRVAAPPTFAEPQPPPAPPAPPAALPEGLIAALTGAAL